MEIFSKLKYKWLEIQQPLSATLRTQVAKTQSERRRNMAIISMFYGIIVSMYFFDNKQHKTPHVHVKYQEQEGVFSIPDGANCW